MSSSIFAAVEMAPRDPILGLNEAFNADPRSTKVNLGVGVYFDDSGKIPLLAAVRAAEEARMKAPPPRGYQPIEGPRAYNLAVQGLLFGAESEISESGRVITVEAIGGTGALKIGADYLRRLLPHSSLYISNPSWENHRALFETAGFKVESYPYYDPETRGVNFPAMKAFLSTLPPNAIILLHACCHNPTGADLSSAEWLEIAELCRERSLVPFLDMAYQGFAEGIDADAVALRAMTASGQAFFVSSSFSKSFSLYGERVGALSIVTDSRDQAVRVLSQVKRVIRTNYSNPPTHGAAIIAAVLESPALRQIWEDELSTMRKRIHAMREGLAKLLVEKAPQKDFSFINTQRGMFSYTGLSVEQVERLKTEFGIYAVSTGRICMAAINSGNIEYVADCIATVTAQ